MRRCSNRHWSNSGRDSDPLGGATAPRGGSRSELMPGCPARGRRDQTSAESTLLRSGRNTTRRQHVGGCAVMSEMWDSAAPGWEANATFVDAQLALATEALLDAAGVGKGDAVLDLAAGPGGAGLAAAKRVGSDGNVVLSDVAAEMVA